MGADVHFFTLATRRLCNSYRPSCTCSTCGPPTNACCTCTALALSTAQLHLQHGAALYKPAVRMRLPLRPEPDTRGPRPLRGLLPLLHTEVQAIAPASCTAYGYVCVF